MTTCLVVDDVTVSRFAVISFLDQLDIKSKEAQGFEDTLAILSEGGVDFILLDWHLKRKSGLDLLSIIREKYGDEIKVIMFSGVEGGDNVAKAKKAGADGYIPKPTTKDKIEEQLKSIGIL